jgi:hypothetical protein
MDDDPGNIDGAGEQARRSEKPRTRDFLHCTSAGRSHGTTTTFHLITPRPVAIRAHLTALYELPLPVMHLDAT